MRRGNRRGALHSIARAAVFCLSLVVLVGWLAVPEAVRRLRIVATSYVELPTEVANPYFGPSERTASPRNRQARADVGIVVVLAALFVVTALAGSESPIRRGVATARRIAAIRWRRAARFRSALRDPLIPNASGGLQAYTRTAVFLLGVGLFLGWLSAPSFIRERDLSHATLGTPTAGGPISATRLLERFSSWVGPVSGRTARELPVWEPRVINLGTSAVESDEIRDAEPEPRPATAVRPRRLSRREQAPVVDEPASPARRPEFVGFDEPTRFRPLDGSRFVVASAPGPPGSASRVAARSDAAPSRSETTPDPGSAEPPGGNQPPDDRNEPPDDGGGDPVDAGGLLPPLDDPGPAEGGPLDPVFEPGEVLVRFAEDLTSGAIASQLGDYSAEDAEYFPLVDYHLLTVPPESDIPGLVERLLADPRIESAQPNYHYVSSGDRLFGSQWSLVNRGVAANGGLRDADIDAEEAWQPMGNAAPSTIAILDTGFDPQHEDLAQVVSGQWNAVSSSPDVRGNADHGTAVAGIAAARGDNTVGIAGVNKRWARLFLVKVFPDGSEKTKDTWILKGIDEIPSDVRVANLSLSRLAQEVPGDLAPPVNALCQAMAKKSKVLFVLAAGNQTAAIPTYPAMCALGANNVVSVASTDKFDLLAVSSNFGPWVEIAAPGQQVLTTRPDGYSLASGTSMAAPQVSGVASLIFAKNPAASAAEVKAQILAGADVLPQLAPFVVGGRRLNACGALRAFGASGCEYRPGL